MKIEGFVEEEVKSVKFNLSHLKSYLVLNFKIESNRPYLCFFFLVDSDGVIRAQFEGRKKEESIFIGKTQGSIGTYPGDFKSGEWILYYTNYGLVENESENNSSFSVEIVSVDKIDLKQFTLIGEEKWVKYPPDKSGLRIYFDGNKTKSDKQKWYRGDFHTHTTLSDCHMVPKETVDYCEKEGIDFLFLTEHNLMHTGFEKSSTLFVPAIEVTLQDGHLLIYGLRDFINCFSFKNFDSGYMNYSIKMAKENGALINVAHPMMVPWDWRFMETRLKDIDMMEIVNCPNWHTSEEDNKKAIELIDILWNEGFRITGVGGSDNHLKPDEKYDGYIGPSLYADPSTYVYSNGLSENAILNAVKKGKVYVSRGLEIDIDISSGNNRYLPGDEIKEDNFLYKIKIITSIYDELNVFLIVNGKIKDKKVIKDEKVIKFNVIWDRRDYNWARVGVVDKNDRFVAYVNPVYKGKTISNLLIWKDLRDKYNQFHKEI